MHRVFISLGAAWTFVASANVPNRFEAPAPGEVRLIEGLAAAASRAVTKHRDAHAKANGCIGGVRFEMRRDLPPELRVGLFATPGAVYEGMLRSSNGSGEVDVSDTLGVGQGLALKLFLDDEAQRRRLHAIRGEAHFREVDRKTYETEDFLGINFPEFFVKDAADSVAFFEARGKAAAAAAQAKAEENPMRKQRKPESSRSRRPFCSTKPVSSNGRGKPRC